MSLINDVLKNLEHRYDLPDAAGRKPSTLKRKRRRLPGWLWVLVAAVIFGIGLHLTIKPSGEADNAAAPPRVEAELPTIAEAGGSEDGTGQSVADSGPSEVVEAIAPLPTDEEDGEQATQAAGTEETLESGSDEYARTGTADSVEGETQAAATQLPAVADIRPPDDGAQPAAETDDDTEIRITRSSPPAGEEEATRNNTAPSPGESEEPISIRRSGGPAEKADRVIAGARRALARGRFRTAERQLRELLEARPGLSRARLLLARIVLDRQGTQSALRELEPGLEGSDDPAAVATMLGRLLLEDGQTVRAAEVLAAHAPEIMRNPDYHVLLAAAHRQGGDHAAAVTKYRELAEVVPSRGAIWVGLGASLEALGERQEAIDAYRRARRSDDPRHTRFAEQRLRALDSTSGDTP